eukprot:PLAT8199.1.p1 GENE.PLAT8199.1~~PLAT8199.1.p1  ORF type:complete len:293 (+),score=133.02 PLAT8199.1:46-924(+)
MSGSEHKDIELGGSRSPRSRAGAVRLEAPESSWGKYCEKGALSNVATFVIMLAGIALKMWMPEECECGWLADYVLSFGLFGFAGGFTNWLAVKMLFDRVPFLIGSGIIPRRFQEIRRTVKDTIMKTFFDLDYLAEQMKTRAGQLMESFDLAERLVAVLDDPEIDAIILDKLKGVAATPEGMMLNMAAGFFPGGQEAGLAAIAGMVKPMLSGFAREVAPKLMASFDITETLPPERVRDEIDALMTEKLRMLTPEVVKALMEEVIRTHLGWLIVWGNVFGGIIGIVSLAAGYGS